MVLEKVEFCIRIIGKSIYVTNIVIQYQYVKIMKNRLWGDFMSIYVFSPFILYFIILIKQLFSGKDKTKNVKRIHYFLDFILVVISISLLIYDTVITNQYTISFLYLSFCLVFVISDIIRNIQLKKKTHIIVMIILIAISVSSGFGLINLYNYKNIIRRPQYYHIHYNEYPLNSGNLVTVYNDKIYYYEHDKIYEMNKDGSNKKEIINKDQLIYTFGNTTRYVSNFSMSVNQNGLYYTRADGIYLYQFSNKQITQITTETYNYIHTIADAVYLFNDSSYTKITNINENFDQSNCEITALENRQVCMFKADEFLISYDLTIENEPYFQVLDSDNNLIYRNKSQSPDYFTPLAVSGENVYAIVQGNLVNINTDNNVTLVSNLSTTIDKINDKIILTKRFENYIYLLFEKTMENDDYSKDTTDVLIRINLSTGELSTLYSTVTDSKVIDFSDNEIIFIDTYQINRFDYITHSYT